MPQRGAKSFAPPLNIPHIQLAPPASLDWTPHGAENPGRTTLKARFMLLAPQASAPAGGNDPANSGDMPMIEEK